MVHLQKLHEQYARKGVVVLGFDYADKAEIAAELMREQKITFASIMDASPAAVTMASQRYGVMAVPITYVIDREGRIADVWVGGRGECAEERALLKKLGLE